VSDELATSSGLGAVPAARTTTDASAADLLDRPSAHAPTGEAPDQPGRSADTRHQRGTGAGPDPTADPEPLDPAEPLTSAAVAMRVVRIALLTALILNTAGFVRAGVTMRPGPMRNAFLAVGHPVDAVARFLDLDRPRRSLDAAFGHPDEAGPGGRTRLERDAAALPPSAARQGTGKHSGGSAAPGAPTPPAQSGSGQSAVAPRPAPVAAGVRRPTAADPLRILVTGDSLSDFDGQQLAKILAAERLPAKLRNQPRNGTGLTQPTVFDWADEAATDAADYDPDVVVMVLGANDGWPLRGASEGSDAWVAEYTRRVEAVTRDFLAGDPRRRVYWVGPPVPRSAPWIHIFDRINQAIRAAVPETPGLRYVDVATPTSDHGVYTDYLTGPDGRRVLARQHDGIHYSWPGSVFPARIILSAVEGEFRLR
jgi:uncharacterized protein